MPYPDLIQPETRRQHVADRIRLRAETESPPPRSADGCRRRCRQRRLGLGVLLAVVAVATVVAAAFVGHGAAAPKPGFLPGTWLGTGVIKGQAVDGPMSTRFGGGITFTLKVSQARAVSGTGTWRMSMAGSQDAPADYAVSSTMKGSAAIRFAGRSTAPTYSGTQKVTGEVRSGGMRQPISMTRPVNGRLAIGRAGACLVRGVTVIQQGVTLTWSAKLEGSGTCNA
jgi:hypothetical protein